MAGQVSQGKQLYRSRDSYVAGVCAGIAEHLDLDPILMRVLAILLTLATAGIGAILYLVLWAVLPREPEARAPYDVTPESAESSVYGSVDVLDADGASLAGSDDNGGRPSVIHRLAIAVGLMILFLVIATNVAPIVPGTQWWQFWPLGFLTIGLCLIIIPVRTRFESVWHALGIALTSLAATVLPMSLGVLSWDTLVNAFEQLWILFAVAAILLVIRMRQRAGNLVIGSAFLVTAFCLLALFSYALPGDLEELLVSMPDGSSLRIAFLSDTFK